MKKPIIAVIDIGSNSIRLQVSKILDQSYKVIEEHKELVRIGDNVFRTGEFSEEAVDTILAVLGRMKIIMDNSNVEYSRVVATASFREAKNANDVVKKVKDSINLEIEIINGTEEARIMSVAASSSFQMSEGNTLIIDMGGGSTEFSYFVNGELSMSETTPLGSSKLTYEFIKTDPAKQDDVRALKTFIKDNVKPFLPEYGVTKLICAGGTINNISAIYNKRNNLSDSTVKFVDTIFLKHFINEVVGKTVAERYKISGLEPTRADIILSAGLLVHILIKQYQLDGFYTLSGGLRVGLTIDLMNRLGYELFFQGGEIDLRYSRLIETGKKYNFESKHSEQVTRLALIIFDQLKNELKLKESDSYLLEAASILHDVGQYIAYSKHHKHSYYLIMNSELTGYSESDINIIANVARYHRRALPKNTHITFQLLRADDKILVSKLASILRIADGLDRSHASYVKDVEISVNDDKIEFKISSEEDDVSMEIAGFEKKKDLLQLITEKDIVLI